MDEITMEEEELREKIRKEFDNFSYAVVGQYASDDIPERVEEIVQLLKAHRKDVVREARIEERQYTWDIINTIRYGNMSLQDARNKTLNRLSTLQVEQDLSKQNTKDDE